MNPVMSMHSREPVLRESKIGASPPTRRAGTVTRKQCELLAPAIRHTLCQAIEAGGSTLRNFVGSDGNPGYFQHQYMVYGRAGEPCRVCGTPIRTVRQVNRATYYCPVCQR